MIMYGICRLEATLLVVANTHGGCVSEPRLA
jgi:hypothetical protein